MAAPHCQIANCSSLWPGGVRFPQNGPQHARATRHAPMFGPKRPTYIMASRSPAPRRRGRNGGGGMAQPLPSRVAAWRFEAKGAFAFPSKRPGRSRLPRSDAQFSLSTWVASREGGEAAYDGCSRLERATLSPLPPSLYLRQRRDFLPSPALLPLLTAARRRPQTPATPRLPAAATKPSTRAAPLPTIDRHPR